MVLGDVGGFMSEYAGKLALRLCDQDQAAVDADVAPWAGEGVDLRILHHEIGKTVGLRIGACHQAVTEILDIFLDLRIIDDLDRTAYVTHELFTQALFFLGRHQGTGGIAEIGECQGWRGFYGMRRYYVV